MMTVIDRYTGRVYDNLSDMLPYPNGMYCDDCGHYLIDRCAMCGAPQCCPKCCIDSLQESS